MKVLCLLDNEVKQGDRWLWKYLPSNNDEIDFLVATGAVDRFQKWGKLLNYYPTYFQAGFQALRKTRQTHYDLVVAWEGKNGFPYALIRSLVGQNHPPLIILAFNIRGVISHFRSLARFGLRSVSRVVVFTPGEVEQYQQLLALPPNKISYAPHGWYDPMSWYDPESVNKSESAARAGKFILASGRSYRDYGTLASAVEGTDVNVKVSGRAFNLAGIDLPINMEATGWLAEREFQDYLYSSSFYVVPLQPITFAGGDSSVLQAMSFGRAVVATRAPSTETYVEHGQTGLLVEPGDIQGMREAILQLWQNPDEAARMGREARLRFEENHTIDKLAQRVYDVALEVCHAQE
ncbi:MAG TPA: glycosyltransferase family 4 protein [Anaerolineales bacterium]|nr:glycosyltransferase family 4 protein [Anaerolineales bacterium]